MSNVFRKINKETVDHIKYRNTVMTGEITAVNSDGTYNVKIAQAGSAYPDVETLDYNANFSVGEVVDIAFEYGNREMPKIIGTAKKIAQEPKEVEVDYSGGAEEEIHEVSINADITLTTAINLEDTNYSVAHNSINGSDVIDYDIDTGWVGVGQWLEGGFFYNISRGYLYFDTSSIPAGATITSALLEMYVDVNSATTIDVVIQNGQPNYPHNPFINSDVNYELYSNNGGQISSDNISTSAYNSITLNSNGRNWINKGGITKFCLRGNKDIANTIPTVNWQYDAVEIDNSANPIKLTITYEI
jgi:hypothetical protein